VDVDWDRQRITLSLKRLTPNPWTHVQERFKDGDVTTGRVVSLANYGAFVEIEPGIEGMIHVSRFGTAKRVQHPREVVSVGAVVQVRIEHMDVDNRRLGLSLVSEAESVACPRREEPSAAPVAVGETHAAVVEKVKPFGVLARLPDGRTGLIPVSELLTPHKAVLRRHYAPGQQLAVQVVEVSEGGKRVRLSERAAREAGDASLANDYFKAQSPTKSSGFGSLGDLLKKPRR
jgi:small subunit ribosomal protein S1